MKKNKYNRKRVTIDNITFDSKRESEYYLILKEKEKNKEITNLQLQKRFKLQDEYINGNNEKIKKIEYIADFVYEDLKGQTHVIDVKGMILPEFKLKKKIFDSTYYPLYIEIVK